MEQNPCPQNHPPGVSDANDFGEVVKNHAAMVRATARRITRDATLAEDVTQETFLALARQPHDTLGSVRAWLRRVAGRKALNAVRSETRRRRVEQAATLASSSPEERSQWSDIAPIIRQTLEELPPDLKEPLVEHYLEGRSQLDIAARKSTSQSTISRQISAGLRELKRHLRAKGILCGAGLTALWSGQSATAASTSSAGLLGKLGAGTAPTSTSANAVTSTFITMTVAKASLAIATASALIGLPLLIMHRQDSPEKPAPSRSSPKSPPSKGFTPASSAKSKSANENASAERRYRPEPVAEEVRLKVAALVARLKDMSPQERMRDHEIMELMQRFQELLTGPEGKVNPRLEKAMIGMMGVKGIDLENPEGVKDIDVESHDPEPKPPQQPHSTIDLIRFDQLDDPVGRSWLEAVVSDDRKRVEDWVVNQIDGAAFEFALDPTLETTSEGVTFRKFQQKPKRTNEDSPP